MEIFTEGYNEYLELRKQRALEKKVSRKKHPPRQARPKTKKAKIDLEEIERNISDLEDQLSLLSEQLLKAGDDIDRVRELGMQYAMVEEAIAKHIAMWEQAASHQE